MSIGSDNIGDKSFLGLATSEQLSRESDFLIGANSHSRSGCMFSSDSWKVSILSPVFLSRFLVSMSAKVTVGPPPPPPPLAPLFPSKVDTCIESQITIIMFMTVSQRFYTNLLL